jgi:hypothetical protein
MRGSILLIAQSHCTSVCQFLNRTKTMCCVLSACRWLILTEYKPDPGPAYVQEYIIWRRSGSMFISDYTVQTIVQICLLVSRMGPSLVRVYLTHSFTKVLAG